MSSSETTVDGGQQLPHEILMQAPGLNPVTAWLEDNPEAVPASGYLISAAVSPDARACEVDIRLFDEGCLRFSSGHYWNEEKDGASAYADLENTTAIKASVAQRFPADMERATDYYGDIRLRDATVYSLNKPLSALLVRKSVDQIGGSFVTLQEHSNTVANKATTHRVVESTGEVQDVLKAVAESMGLDESETRTFVSQIMLKLAEADNKHLQRKLERAVAQVAQEISTLKDWWPVRWLGRLGLGPKIGQ